MHKNQIIIDGEISNDPKFLEGSNYSLYAIKIKNIKEINNKEYKQYIPINCWGELAKGLSGSLKKGMQIRVEGELSIRNVKDKDGKWKEQSGVNANSIELLQTAGNGLPPDYNAPDDATPSMQAATQINDEDLPF